jgi:hypothetical protein
MKSRFIFFCFLLLITSCRLSDNAAPVPYYLILEDPVVVAPLGGGQDSHKITDAWVFADGQILGVFPLPARIPIVAQEGSVEITILAGIRNNGMFDAPVFYPFYKSIVKSVSPKPNGSENIPLLFQYVSNAKIPVNESFESGTSFTIDLDNNINTEIISTGEDARTGKRSGLISLSNNQKFVEVGSSLRVLNSQNSKGKSYIELDYRGEGEIAVGIIKTRNTAFRVDYVLFVPGKPEWNKIYIDVTDVLSPGDYDEYRLALGFSRTGFSETSRIYVDNIKHVHF